MLEITNKKRAKVGLTPARMTEYGYITADRTKLPQSAKVEKVIAVPESKPVAVSQPEKTAPYEMTYEDYKKSKPEVNRVFTQYSSEARANHAASTRTGHRQKDAVGSYGYRIPERPDVEYGTRQQAIRASHEFHIRQAIADGKTVPKEVLRQYPSSDPDSAYFEPIGTKKGDPRPVAVPQPEKIAPKNLPDPKSPIADSTPTEFAKSAIAESEPFFQKIGMENKGDGLYSVKKEDVDSFIKKNYQSVIAKPSLTEKQKVEAAANQKRIDDAIAPLAELTKLRINDTPKHPHSEDFRDAKKALEMPEQKWVLPKHEDLINAAIAEVKAQGVTSSEIDFLAKQMSTIDGLNAVEQFLIKRPDAKGKAVFDAIKAIKSTETLTPKESEFYNAYERLSKLRDWAKPNGSSVISGTKQNLEKYESELKELQNDYEQFMESQATRKTLVNRSYDDLITKLKSVAPKPIETPVEGTPRAIAPAMEKLLTAIREKHFS